MRNKFINGAKVCAHLKNLFTKGGADSVNNYADYINKQSQKKKLSLERIQELNEISLTISWWKENVMKKLDRTSLQVKKHQQESKKEQRLISYFVNNITSGKWTLDDIKSEAYRELVKDYFEASPFGLPQNNQALVMADKVNEVVKTVKIEPEKPQELTLDELCEKYGAVIENDDVNGGWSGKNPRKDLLQDSRKFKSYINNILKTEFEGLKYDLRVSFRSSYYPISLTIKNPSNEVYKNFYDLEEKDIYNSALWNRYWKNAICNHITTWSGSFSKRLYEHYLTKLNNQFNKYHVDDEIKILTPKFEKVIAFMNKLFRSFSYDHSDIMTDYFCSGISWQLDIDPEDKSEDDLTFEQLNSLRREEEILNIYPLEPGEDEKMAERLAVWNKKCQEEAEALKIKAEQERKEYEERERIHHEKMEECKKHYEVIIIAEGEQENNILYNCTFSNWNKACNIEEVEEFKISGGLEGGNLGTQAQICKIVNFTSEEAYDFFCHNFMCAWDFCGCGGCGHVDLKTGESLDYNECYHMSNEEHEARGIAWFRECILIQLNGVNKLVVDPEGHNYCRYVGTIEKATTKKPELKEFDPSSWLSTEDKKRLEDIKRDIQFGEVTFFDFGTDRPKNPNFWNELKKLGTVKIDSCMWSIKGAAA